ncbi:MULTISPECIES: dUTP diphosphatase [Bacillus cereus group]|uniref:dUTP diphosphatase n=3 Tax=root TaxID=1 RepID=D2XQ24_9CAUD|nr:MULTISPECIES: dUTP diphosphatase [Bacillus cereus group]YP_009219624.1 deoxyuridine 5'-triphosphate nucleotidohydrolase [Bacillus phage 250]ANT40213.1 deoxyuridine 5'-triphosphate nucleotidohydrolase [Bacillus phage PfNC7401]ANT40363.1 deoxyuridine 5'-triphosphate nucleotidohydrolase [Bacillus phage PfIS075]EJP82534.1 dUTP diphosphatase [Bacillus cereus IS075]EOO82154.1 dUTP diphosphatase [Bacillus cereus IS845/00]EOO95274.1 dUTP diphosphatase [Bacillus cereus IS195]BAL21513.1 triphosphat
MKLRVKIKRVKDVDLPKYAKPGDSGFDLVAAEGTIIEPGQTKVIPTGLAFEIPPGFELQVRPRSGISRKTFLRVVLGTVDSGFRGEVGVIVSNISYPGNSITLGINDEHEIFKSVTYVVKKGDRIAQGVIAPVETANFVEVDELSRSDRGTGGFGSTGVK